MTRPTRRAYLLLEVVIALALVSLCLIPIIRPHLTLVHKKVDDLRALQLQMAAEERFADLKELLYENKIAWGNVRKNSPHETQLEPVVINNKIYPCNLLLSEVKKQYKSSGNTRRTYRVLEAEIQIGNQQTTFQIFEEKMPAWLKDAPSA